MQTFIRGSVCLRVSVEEFPSTSAPGTWRQLAVAVPYDGGAVVSFIAPVGTYCDTG